MASTLKSVILLLVVSAMSHLYIVSAYTLVSQTGLPLASTGSFPVPPCPMNYMFTCQPHLSPVPCAQNPPPLGAYTGLTAANPVGAYSEHNPAAVTQTPPAGAAAIPAGSVASLVPGTHYHQYENTLLSAAR